MAIRPEDILFYGGGAALKKYGTLSRRIAPIGRSGELVSEVFTRAAGGVYLDGGGVLRSAATNIPRVTHWGDGAILDTPRVIVEDVSTNLCTYSDALSNWTDVGSPTTTDAAVSLGQLDLCLLGDDTGASQESKIQDISYTGDAVKGICAYVKEGATPSAASKIILYDETLTEYRLDMTITFASGVPSVTEVVGSLLNSELISNGVYRLDFQATSVTAGSTNRLYLRPASSGAADTGDIYIGGVQTEDSPFCSSRILTAAAAATRNAETLSFPFWAPPRAMSVYAKFVERQVPNWGDQTIMLLGDTSLTAPYLRVRKITGTDRYHIAHRPTASAVTSYVDVSPSCGDTVEVCGELGADGSVVMAGALNGGAVSTGTPSAALALGTAWSDTLLHIGGYGANNVGFSEFEALIVARGSHSLADFRAILP